MDFEKSKSLERDIKDFKVSSKPLGRGQFGSVFSCVEISNGKEFAIKLLESPTDNEEQYKRFTREVMIQSQANHPAVIPLYCYGENADTYIGKASFIMSPLMKNGSLDGFISHTKDELSPTKKMIIIYGTASAMKYLHESGVIHRDLKPGNILLDESFHPFVADFGFSKFTPRGKDASFSIRPGTPMYIAPELIDDDDDSNLSEKVDVYAFGVILFNILTRQPFCKFTTMFKISQYILKGNRPEIPNTVTPFFQDLITKCWSQKPDDRPTFKEIVTMLENEDNILPETHVKEFERYKKYVNENASKIKDDEAEVDVVKDEKGEDRDIHTMPTQDFNLSFRGYRPASLSKSQDFSKFKPFFFKYNDENFIVCMRKNIKVEDAIVVISIEKKIPPSYLKLTFNDKELSDSIDLSTIKNNATSPIVVKAVKDVSELPKDEDEKECQIEDEIRAKVDFKTTRRILGEVNKAGVEQIDVFHNFFICGKSFSLFKNCLAKL